MYIDVVGEDEVWLPDVRVEPSVELVKLDKCNVDDVEVTKI